MDIASIPGIVRERRQVFDLPTPRLAVTEYRRLQCQCPACGRQCTGSFPDAVQAPTQYGDGVLALVTMLQTEYALPLKKIQRLFTDLYGYALNGGTVLHATDQCYHVLAASQEAIKAQVLASPVCHFDETGIRVEGRLHWHHVASTATATYLFVHRHRGAQALQSPQSLLPAYTGWAVHDCWASYFQFAACHHALCGAHLLRELTALIEHGSRWAPRMHRLLLSLYRVSNQGRGVVHLPDRWNAAYDRVCQYAQREEPLPVRTRGKGKPRRTTGRNLLERLITYKSCVLAFAMHTAVPFTNNQAGRRSRSA
jgi:transposase